jgi:general secretion pathway protein C
MITLSRSRLTVSAVTLVVWLMGAASLTYWVVRISSGRQAQVALPAPAVANLAPDSLAIGRMLGAVAEAPRPAATVASRFSLQGVVAGSPGGGAALISIDGKPAKPFRVGSPVEEGLILQSAIARQAKLAESRDGPVLVTLDMPVLTAN